jgi:protein-L-isoaspartate(D-aspartate) O-methyltransferase
MREGDLDQRLMRFVLEMRQAGVTEPKVLAAMERTPRAAFAPDHMAALALDDVSLPLPCGQIMTKPSLVGRMVTALALSGGERVLEIGCGSGYQTAVMAQIAARVTGLDRHVRLVTAARAALGKLRLDPAQTYLGDGRRGWVQAAPYDRIILNAAVASLPEPLVEQAAQGGMILAPIVGPLGPRLTLWRVGMDGALGSGQDLGAVAFPALSEGLIAAAEECSGP